MNPQGDRYFTSLHEKAKYIGYALNSGVSIS
ncbi:hypothetical protein V6Z12_A06G132600 [Gossypium hirsutum]